MPGMEITAYDNVFYGENCTVLPILWKWIFFCGNWFTSWELVVTFIEFRCISWKLVVVFMEISCHLWKFCVTGADETGPPLAPGRAGRGRSESVGVGRGRLGNRNALLSDPCAGIGLSP